MYKRQAGSSTVTGTGTNFSLLAAGNKIVLAGDSSAYDVVTVKSISNTTQIILEGASSITKSGGGYIHTPTATFGSLDANTTTIIVNDSTATNSTFLFADGDQLIGTRSGANTEIGAVVDTSLSYFEPQLYRNTPSGTTVVPRICLLYTSPSPRD